MKWLEISPAYLAKVRADADATIGPRKIAGPEHSLPSLSEAVSRLQDDPHDLGTYVDVFDRFIDSVHRAGYDCSDLTTEMSNRLRARLTAVG